MDQLDIAIHQTLLDHGDTDGLATFMGISPQILRNKCNPNDDGHKLSARELLSLMILTRNDSAHRVIGIELERHVHTEKRTADIVEAIMSVNVESSDVMREYMIAIADKMLTEREKGDIRKRIASVREALDVLESSVVAAPNQIGSVCQNPTKAVISV